MLELATKDQLFVLVNCLYACLYEDKSATPNDFIELTFSEDGCLEDFSEPIPEALHNLNDPGNFVSIQTVFEYAQKRHVVPRQRAFIFDGSMLAKMYPELNLKLLDPPTQIMLSQIPNLLQDTSLAVSLGLSPFDTEFAPPDGSTVLVPQILGESQNMSAIWQSNSKQVHIQWMQARL